MSDLLEQLRTALGAAYRISHELASVGVCRVFEAEDLELRRRIVIKVMPPELTAAVSADRFRREIQLAASPCATWWRKRRQRCLAQWRRTRRDTSRIADSG